VRQKISVNRAQIASHVGRPIPGPERAYWTSVEGTSMEPWLPNGTMILVEECGEITSGDRYVIWLGDTDANIVKRIERLSDDKLKVASDNPRHETRVYARREANIYEDEEGDTTHIRVQGRVIYPPDTANSILSTVTEQLRKIHN
jgi:phage repressor protein C with HTH and peptisase S24 domain